MSKDDAQRLKAAAAAMEVASNRIEALLAENKQLRADKIKAVADLERLKQSMWNSRERANPN